MARPIRNNVDYFPHHVTHGKKMHYLRNKFGNDAYVVWFMLLEKLGKASYHYLALNDDIQVMYLTDELGVSKEKLIEIIELLVKFGEFDQQLWKDQKIIWNQYFVDSIQDAYRKRSTPCITKEELIAKLFPAEETTIIPSETTTTPEDSMKTPEQSAGNPQRKEEKSKLKKRKEENMMMSELAASDDTLNEIEEIALSFWQLACSTMQESNITSTDLKKQKTSSWIAPVRLAIEKDERTQEEFREVWNFLKNEQPAKGGFMWRTQIRSGQKLREKFEQILLAARNPRSQSNLKNNLNSINDAKEILRGSYSNN